MILGFRFGLCFGWFAGALAGVSLVWFVMLWVGFVFEFGDVWV